jgi:glycosyltransferase involved in cell wall biosynthesis
MRVLQVLGNSAGGIARHVADVVAGFAGSDVAMETAAPPALPVPIPGTVHAVQIPDGPLGHRGARKRLSEIIAEGQFDVIHAHGLRAGIDAARAAGHVPSAVTIHNLVQPEIAGRLRAPIYRLAERLAVKGNDKVLCVSEQIANHLRASIPGDAQKVEVTYLGISEPKTVTRDRSKVRADMGISDRDRVVVTVARLAPQKALHILFAALAQIPDARLIVLGDGPQRAELQTLATRLLGERVVFLGFRDDVTDIVAASDVFALSSIWEGVPISAMEAILVGTVVVSTDVGGMRELVTDRVSGRLVPRDDSDQLAGAIQELLDDPDQGAAFAQRALSDLRRRFDRDAMLERLGNIYRSLAGSAP